MQYLSASALRWWFTTKRRYINYMHLYLSLFPDRSCLTTVRIFHQPVLCSGWARFCQVDRVTRTHKLVESSVWAYA